MPALDDLEELRRACAGIDVYLFDQLLKGRVTAGMKLLDAGVGGGRNVAYLLGAGVEVHAVDRDPAAVAAARRLFAERAPRLPPANVRQAALDHLPYRDGAFDVVLAIAVLHFADDEAHFDAMLGELWRVLALGGLLFARLASRIGIEDRAEPLGGGRFRLPDGSDRFLVDEAMLLDRTRRLGGEQLEPVKTVNVQGQRCMTNWMLRKR